MDRVLIVERCPTLASELVRAVRAADHVVHQASHDATLPYGVDVNYVYNHDKSYYLIQSSATDVDFYDANTMGARAANFNPGTYLYYPMDWVMDDNNNRAWVFKNTGDIVGVNPETGSIVSFASGVTPGTSRTYLWALGDAFVVVRYQSSGTNEFHIVKE